MTGLRFCAGCALTTLLIGASWEAAASGTLGNPEVKAHWLTSGAPPEAEVVSATALPCTVGGLPRRLATDAELVEEAIIGPFPQGMWCDLRLVVEDTAGNRQALTIDIVELSGHAEGILWLDGASVGELTAEFEALDVN